MLGIEAEADRRDGGGIDRVYLRYMAATRILRYDAGNMFRHTLSSARLAHAKQSLINDWKSGAQGWMGCPDDTELLARIERLAKKKKSFHTCLVIGIGGSDLGARSAWHALGQEAKGMRLEFLGGNTDPNEIDWTLRRLDLKKTLINVISKSGDTVEPMSTFLFVREKLEKIVGRQQAARHIVATTDEKTGTLHEMARAEGYDTLPVPGNIGGRFSVLTAVGLFPLACAGINIQAIAHGAREVREVFLKNAPKTEMVTQFAAMHVHADTVRHEKIHVLMPYSERLRLFGSWYRQIWAESLGKEGKGPTPVAALGATDQHSQIQLYIDGPADKVVTFIEVESFGTKLRVPKTAKSVRTVAYLAGMPFEDILHAERAATAKALRDVKRPNGTLFVPRVNAEVLGGLFMFFQLATGVAGFLYGINAYNQPGVEGGKRAMQQILDRAAKTAT